MKYSLKILSIILLVCLFSSAVYAGIGAWSRISGATVTKDKTTPISGTQSLLITNTGAAQGYVGQSIKTTAGDNFYFYGQFKSPATPDGASQLVNVDADASKGMSVRQNLFQGADTLGAYLNCAGTYYAQAGSNTIHDITTENSSFSAWVKVNTNSPAASQHVISKLTADGAYVLFINASGYVAFYIKENVGGDNVIIANTTSIRDGKWHHIACVIDKATAANCKIYLDGISQTITTAGNITLVGSVTNTSIFTLGANQSTSILDGQLCDSKIAIGAVWSGAEVLYQYLHPFDISAGAGTITEAYSLTKGSTTTIPARVTTPTNDLTLSNVLGWENKVKEFEFCFDAADTSTDVDLCVPSAIAADYANYDNLILMSTLTDNPGCEGGADPPTSWVQETDATVVSDTSPHAGTNCLKVTAGADNVGASQAVTLVTGQRYTISGWVKATAGDSAQIVVDTGDTTLLTVGTVTATTWTLIRATFVATGTAGNVYLRGVANTDIVWFDDISIVRLDTGTVTATKGAGIIPSNQPKIMR